MSPDAPQAKVSLFEASTQYKNWRYSVAQLGRIRKDLNDAAVVIIRTKFDTDEVLNYPCYKLSALNHPNTSQDPQAMCLF